MPELTLENFDELWPEPTFEEMVAGSKVIRQTPYGLQDGNGVDVTLIYSNLQLSPLERVRRGDSAARDCEWIRANVRRVAKQT